MTHLEGTIRYWQATLDNQRYMLEPSVIHHIESTIKYLKQLQPSLSEQNSRGAPTLPQNG